MKRIMLVLVPAAVFGGCGETIDEQDLETQLRGKLASPGAAVDCPGGQDVEAGRKFTCTLTARDGSKRRIHVTLTDDQGGYEASAER